MVDMIYKRVNFRARNVFSSRIQLSVPNRFCFEKLDISQPIALGPSKISIRKFSNFRCSLCPLKNTTSAIGLRGTRKIGHGPNVRETVRLN